MLTFLFCYQFNSNFISQWFLTEISKQKPQTTGHDFYLGIRKLKSWLFELILLSNFVLYEGFFFVHLPNSKQNQQKDVYSSEILLKQ